FLPDMPRQILKKAGPPSTRRVTAGQRGPRRAEARTHIVVVVDVRLHFVPHAWTECQVFPRPNVVLHVKPRLKGPVCEVRIAKASRVITRLIREIGLEIVERVRAEIV